MHHDDHSKLNEQVSLGDTDSLNTVAAGQLVHFDDLDDFKIAEGEPDIRGWDVRGTDGQKIGKVEDLLVDTAAMKVRYIEVRLDKEIARQVAQNADMSAHHVPQVGRLADQLLTDDDRTSDPDAARYMLVPIGVARLDEDKDDVLLDAHATQMVGIPAYDREPLTRDRETDIVRSYGANANASAGGIASSDVMNAARPSDVQPERMQHDHSDLKATDDTRNQSTRSSDAFYADRSFDERSFFGSRRHGRDDDSYFARAEQRDRTQSATGNRAAGMDDMSQMALTDEQIRERQRNRESVDDRADH